LVRGIRSLEREIASKYWNWSKHLAFDYPFVARMVETIAINYDLRLSGKTTSRLFGTDSSPEWGLQPIK